jgi:hypothetical protein
MGVGVGERERGEKDPKEQFHQNTIDTCNHKYMIELKVSSLRMLS